MSDGSSRVIKSYNLHTFEDVSVDLPSRTIRLTFFDHQKNRVNIMLSLPELERMGQHIQDYCLKLALKLHGIS